MADFLSFFFFNQKKKKKKKGREGGQDGEREREKFIRTISEF
jgi:hypothetical protein